ncbi:MAG: hypothetical protein CFE26_20095, partial [Verrucomicrobiales bacterium VVV1]
MKPKFRRALNLSSFLSVVVCAATANAATLYWDSNGTGTAGAGATPTGTWGSSVFWTTDSTGANVGSPTLISGTTNADDLFFVAGPGAASGNNAYVVTVGTTQVANSLTFQASGGTTLSGGTSITLGNGTPAAGGITMNQFAYGAVAQGAVTISTPIVLANAQTWTNNSVNTFTTNGGLNLGANTLTFSGSGGFSFGTVAASVISNGSVVMNGTGLLVLGGAATVPVHTYSGGTTITNGTVMFSSNLPASGNLTLNGGVYQEYFGGTVSRALGSGSGQIQITGGASGFSGQGGTGTNFNIGGAAALRG